MGYVDLKAYTDGLDALMIHSLTQAPRSLRQALTPHVINPLTNNFHNYCPLTLLLFPPSTLTLLSPDSTNQTHMAFFGGGGGGGGFIVGIAVLLLQSVPQWERLFRC